MKTIFITSIVLTGALMLLPGCVSDPGSGYYNYNNARPNTVAPKQSVAARPYYHSNAEGSYYYRTDRDTNPNYRPTLRRNQSMRNR